MRTLTEAGTWVSHPPAVQLRLFFPSPPRKLSVPPRIAAQDPRPRNSDAHFTAAKANRKERYLWQDQTQWALHRWPTLGSRTIHQNQLPLLGTKETSAPHRMRPHCLHLGILPWRVTQMTQSLNSNNKFNEQWYFHTQGKTPSAW